MATRFGSFSALANANYRWLWIGTTVTFVAYQMEILARGWLVYEKTSSPLALGVVSAGSGLSMVALAVVGGTVADRVQKRQVIALTGAFNAGISLTIAVLIVTGAVSIWHLAVAAVLTGIGTAFNAPARQSFVPDLVEDRELLNAYGLNYTGLGLSRIAGPVLGGFLVASIGVDGVYFFIVALYCLTVVSTLMVTVSGKVGGVGTQSLVKEVGKGISYVRHNAVLPYLLMMTTVLTLVMSYIYLLPAYAAGVLGVDEVGLGWLMAMGGIGAVGGSLLVAALGDFQRKGMLLLSFAFLAGMFLALVSRSGSFYLALVLLFVVGAGQQGYMAVNQTLIQSYASRQMRGRAASFNTTVMGFSPLGALLFGALSEVWGVTTAMLAGGAFLALSVLVVVRFLTRLRGLK